MTKEDIKARLIKNDGKDIHSVGWAKAYTSEYQFSSAFKRAIDSIFFVNTRQTKIIRTCFQ